MRGGERASARRRAARVTCAACAAFAAARAAATGSSGDARAARMNLKSFASPTALVFGDVTFANDDDGDAEGGDGRGCCALVTCEIGREAHAQRVCDEGVGSRARATGTGANFRTREAERARQFGFGVGRSIESETVTTTVEAEGEGCVVRASETNGTGERFAAVRSVRSIEVARSEAHRLSTRVVVGRENGGSRKGVSGELFITLASVFAMMVVNAGLARLRRARTLESIEDAPASAERDWKEIVGEHNAELVKQIVEEQNERIEHLTSAEWKITAKAPSLDYAAPRVKTFDLVYDFLTSHPQSIAPTYINPEWDTDADDDRRPDESSGRSSDEHFDHDVFGLPFRQGREYRMTIRGHGDQRVAKLALSQVAACTLFEDTALKFYHDQHEE